MNGTVLYELPGGDTGQIAVHLPDLNLLLGAVLPPDAVIVEAYISGRRVNRETVEAANHERSRWRKSHRGA